MMRIGIDIDDVMADSLPRYLQAFNRRFGLKVPVTEARWEIFRRHPEIPADAIGAFFEELYRADFLGSRPLVPGAMEGIEELHRAGHRLFIITGRPRRERALPGRISFPSPRSGVRRAAPSTPRSGALAATLFGGLRPGSLRVHDPCKEARPGSPPRFPGRPLPRRPAPPRHVARAPP